MVSIYITDAFELWCWRRFLRVPWTAKRSNQSIPNKISPGCPLEGLMLKLKLQYFGHLMWRADSFEKTLMLGKIGGRRRRGWQRMRWLDGITDTMDMGLGRLLKLVMDREACPSVQWLNWTECSIENQNPENWRLCVIWDKRMERKPYCFQGWFDIYISHFSENTWGLQSDQADSVRCKVRYH